MNILGIESSCDECSLAVVRDGRKILSHVIFSQTPWHAEFQGVVPEIASRLHVEMIAELFLQSLKEAQISASELDLIAVTHQPGLLGSLLVGLNFAKGLALGLCKPLIGIDHILAHLYAVFLDEEIKKKPLYPFLSVLLSGGHTLIALQRDFDTLEILGSTYDDACGEAFDKVAKYFSMGFPGGPAVDRLARLGNPHAYTFPRIETKGRYDLSYSGLKTAVIHQNAQFLAPHASESLENIAASFEKAALDTLLVRVRRALEDFSLSELVFAGGVASNSYLRTCLASWDDVNVYIPQREFCTDNAAMIAALAFPMYQRYGASPLTLEAYSRVKTYKNYVRTSP